MSTEKIEAADLVAGTETPEPPRERTRLGVQLARIGVPIGMLVLLIVAWQEYVTIAEVPHYILPAPTRIAEAFVSDWPILGKALLITLRTTFLALVIALVSGVALAILMAQS